MSSFREKCRELRRRDYTLPEIIDITGRAKSTVWYQIKDIDLSEEKQKQIKKEARERAKNLKPNEKDKSKYGRSPRKFDKWSKVLTLLFGHLLFDGEINRSECRYSSSHETLINRVLRLMQDIYPYKPKHSVGGKTEVMTISYYNVELGKYALSKSRELINEVENMSDENKLAFLVAFFDDEGCAQYNSDNNKRRVRGYQDDMEMLKLIQKLLLDFGIESTIRENTCNEIVISRKDNLERFQNKINFSPGVRVNHERANSTWDQPLEKREILRRAINSYQK